MNYKQILKIDLDIKDFYIARDEIKTRLIFLNRLKLLLFTNIVKVELLKKEKHSCRIYLKKSFKDGRTLIIIQAILGSDYKHVGVTFRDYLIGVQHFNKLFTIKRYIDGDYKEAEIIDITKFILDKSL